MKKIFLIPQNGILHVSERYGFFNFPIQKVYMPITLPYLISGGVLLYSIMNNDLHNKPEFNIYRQRSMKGLGQDTQDIIKLITFSDNTEPVGSFKYSVHRYPGDVDIFEPVKICCTREQAISTITRELQSMANKVKNSKTVFWGDFKAGLDMAFDESHKENYIVRWTMDDVINGEKLLKSGNILKLEEAITHKTLVKLDLWSPIDGNYTEVTNFFLFMWTDGVNEHILNAPLEDREKSLEKDIKTYSKKDNWKPLKVAKRMWSLALYRKDERMTKALYPLFSSGIAILSQIASECETLSMMYRRPINRPEAKLEKQISGFKRRMNDAMEIEISDSLYVMIDEIIQTPAGVLRAVIIDRFRESLEEVVSEYTGKWMKKRSLI
jgi:hypothetical protein